MKRKYWIWIGIIIVAGLAAKFLFFSGNEKTETKAFTTAALTRGNIENTVSSTGTLSALETVEVGSQVSGIVQELKVDYNSTVTKGQLLAVLDKTPFLISVQEAEAKVDSAAAEFERLEAELKRNQPLFEKGHISETEYLQWKTQVLTARASLKSARASLKKAQTNLGYTEIRSPMNGTVIERSVDEGQTIAASFQAPQLFIIAEDLTQMQIEAFVDESDIGVIREGQKARFTVQSYPDREFTGTVRQIRLQPTTISNVVNYTVVVDAENQDRLLLPGMTTTVDFLLEYRENVLIVPNSALSLRPSADIEIERPQRDSSDTPPADMRAMMSNPKTREKMGYVFIADESGKLKVAFFQKGATDGSHTEVLKSRDLKEGLQVVTGFTKTASSTSSNGRNPFMFGGPPRGGRPR